MSAPDDLSREELISLARTQDARIVAQDAQIAELTAVNEVLAARLARVEHLLSRNSSNSSSPPSKDDDPEPYSERFLAVGRLARVGDNA